MSASSALSADLPRGEGPARTPVSWEGFVESGGIRWFVRREGRGPVLLLLHGTGSSSDSWRHLIPLLAQHFAIVAPDLPGHGRTSPVPRGPSSLPVMARAAARLMSDLRQEPRFIAGHSAGAAISAQMVLGGSPSVKRMAWIAGALTPFSGLAGLIAPSLARVLSRSGLLPPLVAWSARSGDGVRRMIARTGSAADDEAVETYRALLRRPSHVAGALAMMADWDLAGLSNALPALATPVLLMHGDRDLVVPVRQSDAVAARLAAARVERLQGLGHLAHEEQPRRVADVLLSWFGADAMT